MSNTVSSAAQPSANAFYRAVWRWHFYAGLYVVPFIIMLAITGLAILWFTTIAPEYGDRLAVPQSRAALPITAQSDFVAKAYPQGKITQYIAPYSATNPALFSVALDNGDRMIALDPYTGAIIQDVLQAGTWNDFFTRVHGSLFLGPKTAGLEIC